MAIYDEVLSFIESPKLERFEALALQAFRHQFISVAPYREFCLSRGVHSDMVKSLDEVPALSTAAFKYVELGDSVTSDLLASRGAVESRVFVTSGMTVGDDTRGRHRVPRLDIYRASALRHVGRMIVPRWRQDADAQPPSDCRADARIVARADDNLDHRARRRWRGAVRG